MKKLLLILLLAAPITLTAQKTVTLEWTNPDAATLALDLTVGVVLQHAGESGAFTNIGYAPLPATNWTSSAVFYQGLHQFQALSTNKSGLLSLPSNIAATNLTWNPVSPSGLIIKRLTTTNVTITLGLMP